MSEEQPYLCGKHDAPLSAVMAGGAGWCGQCHAFVQSANHAQPTIPDEQRERCERQRAELKKQKAREAARKRKAVQRQGVSV